MTLLIEYLDKNEQNKTMYMDFPDDWKEHFPDRYETIIAMSLGEIHKIKSIKEVLQ